MSDLGWGFDLVQDGPEESDWSTQMRLGVGCGLSWGFGLGLDSSKINFQHRSDSGWGLDFVQDGLEE